MGSSIARSVDPLGELRLQIHQAALEPDLWHEVVASITRLVGGRSGHMMLMDTDSLEPSLYVPNNIDPDAERQFQAYWYQHDPWMQAAPRYPARSVIVGQEMVPDETLLTSAFYNDFARHQSVGRILANLFDRDGATLAHVTAHRAARDEEFGELEREVMRTLAPHLATAMAVHVRLAGLEDRIRATEAALDWLPVGLCLIDRGGKVTHRNRVAREIQEPADGLAIRCGRLHAWSARDQQELTTRIAQAVAAGRRGPAFPGALLSIRRPSLRRPYSVLVAPVRQARDSTRGVIGEARPCALLLITDLERKPAYPSDFLAQRYQLTAAEARLACELVHGGSLQDAADRFGVTIETVRGQLKQIFAKAEVNRQSQLVRLLISDLATQAVRLAADSTAAPQATEDAGWHVRI